MLIEAARRAEVAVKEMLAIAHDGSATTDEFRDALAGRGESGLWV